MASSAVSGIVSSFEVSCLLDFKGNAIYIAFYFPKEMQDGRALLYVLSTAEEFVRKGNRIVIGDSAPAGFKSEIRNMGDSRVQIYANMPGDLVQINFDDMVFTKRVFFYHENEITNVNRLYEFAESASLKLICRGPAYVQERSLMERPRSFISHDSRDKENIARPIASRLRNMSCPVWYDEFTLTVGDSLRESIERVG